MESIFDRAQHFCDSSVTRDTLNSDSRYAQPSLFAPRKGGFQIKASGKAEEAPQTFARHQHKVVARPLREPAQPRFYRYRIRRIADGDHWTMDSIGTALFQHAEQLAKFARFRHHNSSPAQLFRHAQSFFAALLDSPSWRLFMAIARLQLTVAINALSRP